VERKMTIRSTPPGAEAYLNDEPLGQTPITVNFTWYGDYNVTLRKPGYKTISEGRRPPTPWYQAPVVDFFSENFWPGTFKDEHVYEFTLQPAEYPEREGLIQRAAETRESAVRKLDTAGQK
jgi:hypothetical protein